MVPMINLRVCILLFASLVCFVTHAKATEVGTELSDREVLRVCADPNNLPFSNKKKEGFENEIAELIAAEMKIPVAYFWFPQTTGFVRQTLRTRRCDLIIGVAKVDEFLQNTNPYYTSIYTLVYRTDAGYTIKSLSDKVLHEQKLKIGIIAGTLPANLLLENGLIEQMVPYRQRTYLGDDPITRISEELLNRKVDVLVLWGPVSGHIAKKNSPHLTAVPLTADQSKRHNLMLSITMGIRRGESQWKRQLNRFINKNKDKIDAILQAHTVPMVAAP